MHVLYFFFSFPWSVQAVWPETRYWREHGRRVGMWGQLPIIIGLNIKSSPTRLSLAVLFLAKSLGLLPFSSFTQSWKGYAEAHRPVDPRAEKSLGGG